MARIPAYITKHDLSLVITMFDGWGQVKRRTFYLRNLDGDSLEKQVTQAEIVATELAEEMHHVGAVGIDKVDIKAGRHKAGQVVYGYEPHPKLRYFSYGLKFALGGALTYKWRREGNADQWYVAEEEISDGWERTMVPASKQRSFDLPCHSADAAWVQSDEAESLPRPFITFGFNIQKRRRGRRRTAGWHPKFDRHDVLYQRFVDRFSEGGSLCVGNRRCFTRDSDKLYVTGIKYAPPNFKREPAPRKTYLASQPQDETDFVYVIRMGRHSIFKIGKSNDPRGRMESLQSANPHKLTLFHVFRADNASAAEEQLHAIFHDARMEGEWFRLSAEQKEALAQIDEFKEKMFVAKGKSLTIQELLESGD